MRGSAGPLDLFASGQLGGGFSYTRVLARLSVRGAGAKGKATISVRDAGDPVAGVTVAVDEARHDGRSRTGDSPARARLVRGTSECAGLRVRVGSGHGSEENPLTAPTAGRIV